MYNGFAILIIRSNALRSNKSRTDRKRAGSACKLTPYVSVLRLKRLRNDNKETNN